MTNVQTKWEMKIKNWSMDVTAANIKESFLAKGSPHLIIYTIMGGWI